MSRLLDAVSRLFVEPAPSEPAAPPEAVRWVPPAAQGVSSAPGAAAPRRVVVLCAPGDGRAAGGAAGLALAHRLGAPAVLVLEWAGAGRPPDRGRAATRPARTATGAARRLCAGLAEPGALASGRLVRCPLPADDEAAVAAAHRLLAWPVPGILVLAGPRGERLDGLVARADRLLLVLRRGADAALADLAEAELGSTARRVARVQLGSSPGAAALARAGTALVAPLRGPFLDALE